MTAMFENFKHFFRKEKTLTTLSRLPFSSGSSSILGDNNISLYEKSLYVNAAIKKRAEKVGQIQFVIRNLDGEEITKGKEFDIYDSLLNKPNQHQTGDQFWGLVQKYLDITGSAFVLKVSDKAFDKTPDSLEILESDQVTVKVNQEERTITGFVYTNNGKSTTYTTDEVIYFYNPSVRNQFIGESLLSSAALAVESSYQVEKYHASVLRNGGKLETLIKVKDAVNKQQLEDMQAQYEEKYKDAVKAGRPLIMGGDIDTIVTGLSPRELAFLETKVSTYRDIAIATGVPVDVLGVTSDSTYSNADAAIKVFLRETIKPLHQALVEVLNWRLFPDNLILDFVDPTPEDREETRKDLMTAYEVRALTTNEMREKLGLEPLAEKEADQILVPFTMRPIGNSAPINPPEEKSVRKEVYHPLRDKTFRGMWAKVVNNKRDAHDRVMEGATVRFFEEQRERVLETLPRKRKIGVDEVFNSGLEITLAKEALVPVIRSIFIEQGHTVAETFGLPSFSITDQVERTLRERAEMFTHSIINTTHEQLQREFRDSLEAGEPRAKLIERINNLYTEITEGRATMIARTEVHAAMQEANLEAYRQGGLTTKIWVWSGNTENLREIHYQIDGEEQPLESPFSTGEMVPSLPNCACTI